MSEVVSIKGGHSIIQRKVDSGCKRISLQLGSEQPERRRDNRVRVRNRRPSQQGAVSNIPFAGGSNADIQDR